MSFYTKASEDEQVIAPDNVSAGSQIGFIEGVKRSWAYGNLYESQLGVAQALLDEEYKNNQRMVAAGLAPPESAYYRDEAKYPLMFTSPIGDFNIGARDKTDALKTATRLATSYSNGDIGLIDAFAGAQNAKLKEYQASHPDAGIKTYDEMYGNVRTSYEKMKAGLERNYSNGGSAGWFVGGVAAGVNPNTNPLSALTLPVGGFGKNVLTRVTTESAAQGAVQALEEVTGVRGNKRALGENPSVAESIGNIGFAAVGGGALQGVGEAAAFTMRGIKRKWFADSVNDPAPVPPVDTQAVPAPVKAVETRPLSIEAESRINQAVRETAGTARPTRRVSQVDYNHVARALEDWAGPRPWEIAPPTYSRFTNEVESANAKFEASSKGETVDEIARRIDPDTFKVYDKLAAEKQTYRDTINQALNVRKADVVKAQLEPLRLQLAQLENKIATANKRKTKIYENQRMALQEQIANIESAGAGLDDATTTGYRNRLLEVDYRMRDMSEAVSRAYARAEKKWQVYGEQRAQLEEMVMRGDTKIPNAYSKLIDDAENMPVAATVHEATPGLKAADVKPGEAVIDAALRQTSNDAKLRESNFETLRADIPKILKLEGDEAVIDVQGVPTKLKLSDEIMIDDGNDGFSKVTVRQMLEAVDEDTEVFGAITTCSVGAISATA